MFENLGPTEMMMIAVIVVVLFGAQRVPEIGASIGKGIREFKRGMHGHADDSPLASSLVSSRESSRPVKDTPDVPPKRLIDRTDSLG